MATLLPPFYKKRDSLSAVPFSLSENIAQNADLSVTPKIGSV